MPCRFYPLSLVALMGLVFLGAIDSVQAQPEILTRDGFPADYQTQDFTPTGSPVSPTIAPGTGVAPHLDPLEANDQAELAIQQQTRQQKAAARQSLARPKALTEPTGKVVGKSFAIDDLPHTSGPAGPGRLRTTTASAGAVSANVSDVVAPSLTLPQPNLPLANELPADSAALAGWGPLTPAAAGFNEIPADHLWAGVDATALQGVLNQIASTPPASAALKTALTRLLLVQAAPPKGSGAGWLATRAAALTTMGRDEAALQLWRGVPPPLLTDEPLAHGWVNAQLVAGESRRACEVARRRIALTTLTDAQKTSWQPVIAVCQELAGDVKGAALSWQLATSAGQTLDPFLRQVKDAWDRRQPLRVAPPPTDRKDLDPLAAALLAARPALLLTLPQLAARLPQVALRRIMNTPGLPVGLRLTAAENLAASEDGGAAILESEEPADSSDNFPANLPANPDAAAVAILYHALPFAAEIQHDPLGAAGYLAARNQGSDRETARALLWQTARPETANAATDASLSPPLSLRALAWQRWHDQVLQAGIGGLLTGLPVTRAGIQPADSIGWLAPMALAGAWRSGQPAPAPWFAVMSSSTILTPQLPFLRLANSVLAGDPPDAAAWATGLQGAAAPAPAGAANASRLLAVAQALGLAPPADTVQAAWLQQGSGQLAVTAAPSPLWQDAVTAAVQQKQAGLAILLLCQPQAGEDPTATGWLQVRLRALRALGLDGLAKRLAGEALALPLASLTEAVEPAPPALNNGHAPVPGGQQIGGAVPAAADASATADPTNDGLLLPPPRIAPGSGKIHHPTIKKPLVNRLGKLPLTPANQTP